MDPISNIDRLVLILRQRLQERAKAAASKTSRRGETDGQQATGIENVQALAGAENVDDEQLGRALIQSILTDYFGQEMLNEAKFQQIVDRVANALREDPNASSLLGRMVHELRTTN